MNASTITSPQLDKYKKILNEENRYKYYFTNDENGTDINHESIFTKSYNHLIQNLSAEIKDSQYDTLILLVGFSIQPLVLSICILKPQTVYLLYSKETKKYCDKIHNWTSKILEKNPPTFVGANNWCKNILDYQVDSSNPEDTYNKILSIVNSDVNKDKKDNIAIDITGGKKTMVAGAFNIAAIKDIDTYYVDFTDYDGNNPIPGTELFAKQKNPIESFIKGISKAFSAIKNAPLDYDDLESDYKNLLKILVDLGLLTKIVVDGKTKIKAPHQGTI
ncbi:MAG: hypothetical protein ACYDEE_12950 [Ignavibacteriaceae bacterium]